MGSGHETRFNSSNASLLLYKVHFDYDMMITQFDTKLKNFNTQNDHHSFVMGIFIFYQQRVNGGETCLVSKGLMTVNKFWSVKG